MPSKEKCYELKIRIVFFMERKAWWLSERVNEWESKRVKEWESELVRE